jgi:nitroreductase
MEVSQALTERRTIRKFTGEKIPEKALSELIEYARVCAYPANMQPLKFSVITDKAMLDKIFPHTKWAGYLADGAPKENERPTAYIAVFGDKEIKSTFETEAGAAITAMMTGAWDKGIASCWLGALNRKELMSLFGLSESRFELLYLLALGYPLQKSRICEMADSVKYYEDEEGIINVPKRSLEEIIISLSADC